MRMLVYAISLFIFSCTLATAATLNPPLPGRGKSAPPYVIIATGGNIVARYSSGDDDGINNIYLYRGEGFNEEANFENDQFMFGNFISPVGSPIDLGYFERGSEIVLRMREGANAYLTGPGERNPDGRVRAYLADVLSNRGSTYVSFNSSVDYFMFNWSHNSVVLTNTIARLVAPVPLPATLPLLILTFSAIAGLRALRKRR